MNKPYSYFDRLRRARPTKTRQRRNTARAHVAEAYPATERTATANEADAVQRWPRPQPVAEF